jgi:hypothetical protein
MQQKILCLTLENNHHLKSSLESSGSSLHAADGVKLNTAKTVTIYSKLRLPRLIRIRDYPGKTPSRRVTPLSIPKMTACHIPTNPDQINE